MGAMQRRMDAETHGEEGEEQFADEPNVDTHVKPMRGQGLARGLHPEEPAYIAFTDLAFGVYAT